MEGHPIFARFYDRLTARTERSGLAEMRRELLAQASGRTLELGAGTGHNLGFYTDRVSELVLSEPDPHMARRLGEQLRNEPPAPERVEVIEARAEDLPFDDGSFDTVVSTLVLAEARRLLVEGGALLFLEHVRSQNRRLVWWQDRLERPWGFFAGGCHPNRPTEQTLADAGLWIERLDRDRLPAAPRIVKPVIRGLARRPD